MTKKRIFLIDRHALVRDALQHLINAQPDLSVCGESQCCQESLPYVTAARPDLAIIEPLCRTGFRFDVITCLRANQSAPRILAISMGEEALYAERALRAGADGYLSKDHPTAAILAGIQQVLRGEVCLPKPVADAIVRRITVTPCDLTKSTVPVEQFSDRELEIFRRIGQGQATGQIAKQLSLSVSTVETYRLRLKEKLGLKTGPELNRCAVCWVENDSPHTSANSIPIR